MHLYEQLGLFYLGKRYDLAARARLPEPVLYDSRDLLTHAVCVGMTGSGKTGLGIGIIEEAALDGIPVLAIDPKGDLANLLLTFPTLTPAEFRPWVDAAAAHAAGLTPDAFAGREAAAWRDGLTEWDQDAQRITRLQQSAEVRVFTPGSRAATPLAVLRTLVPAADADDEEIAAGVSATVDSLLRLAGISELTPHSPEHVLLSTMIRTSAASGQPVDLPWLVQNVQKPAFDRIGVLDLETFFPARERQALALRLNGVLAAPGFDVWLSGEPLDMGRLLYTPEGKPRVAIVSIAHLDDAQRMLAVSLILNEALAWTRRQSGTAALRALIYMDEIAGYLPPTASPPSKPPLLTLMKQARAFGVGVMLATQNPVDLDYKGLSNAGTWFLGKLQTERDKARVLDGLEGAAPGTFDRASLDRMLSALGKRVFLLHNVHEPAPVVFETRWTLSYLRGPMTRDELRRLTAAHDPALAHDKPPASSKPASPRPVLPAGIREFFLPGTASEYDPALYGAARMTYTDAKRAIDVTLDINVIVPFGNGAIPVRWDEAIDADVTPEELRNIPASPGAPFGAPPAAALDPRSYPAWERDLADWLLRSRPLQLFSAPSVKMASTPGESERDFRIRVQLAHHERRDEAVERLREKYATRIARLTDRIAKAEAAAARERQQVDQQKVQTAVSIGAAVVGALMGRKAVSLSTLGRATTAARGVGRSAKEADDVVRADARVADLQSELAELQAALEADIAAVAVDASAEALETVAIKPKRGGVNIRLVALAWRPSAV
jgi:hypothetical protein